MPTGKLEKCVLVLLMVALFLVITLALSYVFEETSAEAASLKPSPNLADKPLNNSPVAISNDFAYDSQDVKNKNTSSPEQQPLANASTNSFNTSPTTNIEISSAKSESTEKKTISVSRRTTRNHNSKSSSSANSHSENNNRNADNKENSQVHSHNEERVETIESLNEEHDEPEHIEDSSEEVYIEGRILGLSDKIEGKVLLYSAFDNSVLESFPVENERFTIRKAVLERGKPYALKAEIPGYRFSPITSITTETEEIIGTAEPIQEENIFRYHWEQDQSPSGLEYSSHINTPITVEYLDEEKEIPAFSLSEDLHQDYGIVLDGEEWTREHAFRLYETLQQIPSEKMTDSRWILATGEIEDDIEIQKEEETVVIISSNAFAHAEPKIVRIEGEMGRFFSKRLHHALVRYITNNGEDEDAVEKILKERFSVSIDIPKNKYPEITTPTGGEHHDRFQKFSPEESLMLITQMEEMPEGFHKIPELKYLLRRANGQQHPLYPQAAAVSWPESGYIEFMESAFTSDYEHTQRLIVHEKTHFLWAHEFSKELKREWADIGGWTPGLDPDTYDGWNTTKTTEFVTAYSHGISPNEDMAESISFFLFNPEKLKSVSPEKYEFIKKRIMHGTRYYTHFRDDLTFEVHNLDPDYVYPGKITEIDVSVSGRTEDDKQVDVVLKLHKESASLGFMRINSPTGTYKDVYLYPAAGESSTTLKVSFIIPKEAKEGYWTVDQIVLQDRVGNERYQDSSTFGWSMYVNNSGEDKIPPEYVSESITLQSQNGLYKIVNGEIKKESCEERSQACRFATFVTVEWDVIEEIKMEERSACYVAFRKDNNREYSIQDYGDYKPHDSPNSTGKCVVQLTFNEFLSGTYKVASISMKDRAGNRASVDFNNDGVHEKPVSIDIEEITPDTQHPRLHHDVEEISVNAEPANLENPNGRTIVVIAYSADDDLSGLDTVLIKMRDPQGKTHSDYHYHDNFYTDYFTGDPTEKTQYTFTTTLPEGSAPGIWGVSLITLYDKAGNRKDYDFTETMTFNVITDS